MSKKTCSCCPFNRDSKVHPTPRNSHSDELIDDFEELPLVCNQPTMSGHNHRKHMNVYPDKHKINIDLATMPQRSDSTSSTLSTASRRNLGDTEATKTAVEDESKSEKFYRKLLELWDDKNMKDYKSLLWRSEFVREHLGWTSEGGIIKMKPKTGRKTGKRAAATAGVVLGVLATGFLGAAVLGTGGAFVWLRYKQRKLQDRMAGFVQWEDRGALKNLKSIEKLESLSLNIGNRTDFKPLGEGRAIACEIAANTGFAIALEFGSDPAAVNRTPDLQLLVTWVGPKNEESLKSGTNLNESSADGPPKTVYEAVKIRLMHQGMEVKSISADIYEICNPPEENPDAPDMYDVFLNKTNNPEVIDESYKASFWVCISADTVAVGFGTIPGKQLRFSFDSTALVSEHHYRICSFAVSNMAPLMGTVKFDIERFTFSYEEIAEVIRWRDETMEVVENLEYHMHKGNAQLRALRGDYYVYHIDEKLFGVDMRIVVSNGHIVLMRKASGVSAKLHLHTQYRLLGAVDLHNVTQMLSCEHKGFTLYRVFATDGTSLVFPDATPERSLGHAALWLLQMHESNRCKAAGRIKSLMEFSSMFQCGACGLLKEISSDVSSTPEWLPSKYTCQCIVSPASFCSEQGSKHSNAGSQAGSKLGSVSRQRSENESSPLDSALTSFDLATTDMGKYGLDEIGGRAVWKPVCIILGCDSAHEANRTKLKKTLKKHQKETWDELGRTEINHDSMVSRFRTKIETDIFPYDLVKIEVHLFNNNISDARMDEKDEYPPTLFFGEAVLECEPIRKKLRKEKHLKLAQSIIDSEEDKRGNLHIELQAVERSPSHHKMIEILGTLETISKLEYSTPEDKFEKVNDVLCSLGSQELLSLVLANGSQQLPLCLHYKDKFQNTKLMTYLSNQVDDLSLPAKVQLIRAFKKRVHSLELFEQQIIAKIFESTKEKELFDLKDLIDVDSEGVVNMSRLIYDGVKEPELQSSLLKHFESEGTRLFNDASWEKPMRIMSDIDDTLVHSGLGLGGPKYKSGTVLPGFVQLVRTLGARVAFVTARPQFVKHMTYKTLRDRYGIYDAVCLFGELKDSVLIPFAPDFSNEKIAARKMDNIHRYIKLFPECRFCWWGDSGQGDILVGEQLNQKYPARMCGVYIQDVVKSDGLTFLTSPKDRLEHCGNNINVVDNYCEVANHMYKSGVLNAFQLLNVSVATARTVRSLMPEASDTIMFRAFEHEKHLKVALELIEAACAAGDTTTTESEDPIQQ